MSVLVPMVIDNVGGNERVMDIYTKLLDSNIIMLTTDFNDVMASSIISQMLYLDSKSHKTPISLYINSPGGIVTSALTILNTMNFIKAPVHTYVIGQAASCGSLIAQAGEPGHRYMLPLSKHMVHRISSGSYGTQGTIDIQKLQYEDNKRRMEESERVDAMLTKIYTDNNSKGKDFETIHADMRFDTYYTAEESIEYGLADKIIENVKTV